MYIPRPLGAEFSGYFIIESPEVVHSSTARRINLEYYSFSYLQDSNATVHFRLLSFIVNLNLMICQISESVFRNRRQFYDHSPKQTVRWALLNTVLTFVHVIFFEILYNLISSFQYKRSVSSLLVTVPWETLIASGLGSKGYLMPSKVLIVDSLSGSAWSCINFAGNNFYYSCENSKIFQLELLDDLSRVPLCQLSFGFLPQWASNDENPIPSIDEFLLKC